MAKPTDCVKLCNVCQWSTTPVLLLQSQEDLRGFQFNNYLRGIPKIETRNPLDIIKDLSILPKSNSILVLISISRQYITDFLYQLSLKTLTPAVIGLKKLAWFRCNLNGEI